MTQRRRRSRTSRANAPTSRSRPSNARATTCLRTAGSRRSARAARPATSARARYRGGPRNGGRCHIRRSLSWGLSRVGAFLHPCGCESIRVGVILPDAADKVPGQRKRQDANRTHMQRIAPTCPLAGERHPHGWGMAPTWPPPVRLAPTAATHDVAGRQVDPTDKASRRLGYDSSMRSLANSLPVMP